MRYSNVIFVASTLPLKNPQFTHELEKADLIVCSTSDVMNSMLATRKFLCPNQDDPNVRILSNEGSASVIKLFRIITTSRNIVITHECAWPALDLILALTQRPVVRLLGGNLNGMSIISIGTLTRSLWGTDSKPGMQAGWFTRLMRLCFSPLFEFRLGGGLGGNWIAWTIRNRRIRTKPLRKSPDQGNAIKQYNSAKFDFLSNEKGVVLFTISSPAPDQTNALEMIRSCLELVLQQGYECWVKDHIRINNRLGEDFFSPYSKHQTFRYVEPSIPSEIVTKMYSVQCIIGLDSAALTGSVFPSASLMQMLEMPQARKKDVIRYLTSLDSNELLFFPKSWEEFNYWLNKVHTKGERSI